MARRMTDDECLQLVMRRLASAERHMQPILERVRRARLVFLGRTNPNFGRKRAQNDPADWRSMVFPPIANEQAELLFAEMTVDDPRFGFSARKVEFRENASAAEQAVDFYNDRDRFARTFRKSMRAAIRDGGAIVRTTWGKNEHGEWGVQNRLRRLEDIFPDPTATEFDQCRWVIERTRATMDDLLTVTDRSGECIYKNLAKLAKDSGSRDGDEQRREGETEEAFQARTTGVHTLHTMWTPHGRVVVADRSVVILRNEGPVFERGAIPFTMVKLIDDEDCIVGVSPMTLIDDLQEAYWSALNALIDAINLATNPPRLADIEEDTNAANYPIYPGCTIPARNGEATVKVLQDLASLDKYNVAQLCENLRSIMERLTGMNSAIAGVSMADTATEAAINVRQGKGRVGAELTVADDAWAQVAKLSYWRIQEFCSEEIDAVLSGGSAVRFAPEHLVDMMIVPKSAASERSLADLERQDAQNVLTTLQGLVSDPSQLPRVDLTEVVRRVCEAFRLPTDIVQPPLPMPQMAAPAPMPGAPPDGGSMGDMGVLGSIGAAPPASLPLPPVFSPQSMPVVSPRPGPFLGA